MPTLHLTPQGHLILDEEADAPALPDTCLVHLAPAFGRGAGHGLLDLGSREVGSVLPPVCGWWRDFAARFVTAVRTQTSDAASSPVPAPGPDDLQALAWTAPPMMGAEYLSAEVLLRLWSEMESALHVELAESRADLATFLHDRHSAWNLVGRVHLHLAENCKDPSFPFAFLATYSTRLTAQAKAQHLPLGQALKDSAESGDKGRLLALLMPVQRAGEHCPWLKALMESRALFHPLRWTAAEALRFLHDVEHLEAAGVVVRLPAGWPGRRPARPQVTATVGGQPPSVLGMDALLDFSVGVTLDGETLTQAEIKLLLAGTQGLVLIRGRWVEVDGARLKATLERYETIQRLARDTGLPFHEALRLLSGSQTTDERPQDTTAAEWSQVVAGPWLAQTLAGLRSPQGLVAMDPGPELVATLRPYQQVGVRWLHLVSRLGLGACLADDMGLGKTIQVIAMLLIRRRQEGNQASLLVVPASLLANWAAEIRRFAPSMKILIAHPSDTPLAELKDFDPTRLTGLDLVITSYGFLHRLAWLTACTWRLAILDEAQAIKNPGTRQTRTVKTLKAGSRMALTGTPVENRLGDLWSIFDYINPGLLGTARTFTALTKGLAGNAQGFAPLRRLVAPYILRRLKTDKTVIADLPDKTEVNAWCALTRRQAALYQQAVDDLAKDLAANDGIARKGVVLAALSRFKQICNHPSQWLGDQAWDEAGSGKLARLRDLAEVVAAKQEKMLLFSQYREVAAPLAAFLGGIFGRSGLVLTGETAVKTRQDLVRRFQEDETVPFFILSLKAGGSGLNLTAASHVVHFDRWWNPAVENQATDRAFRIGQTRNVLVHKFICRGTVEERIDEMIGAKSALARDLVDGAAEIRLTELSDDELLKLVRLDITSADLEA